MRGPVGSWAPPLVYAQGSLHLACPFLPNVLSLLQTPSLSPEQATPAPLFSINPILWLPVTSFRMVVRLLYCSLHLCPQHSLPHRLTLLLLLLCPLSSLSFMNKPLSGPHSCPHKLCTPNPTSSFITYTLTCLSFHGLLVYSPSLKTKEGPVR